MANENKEIGDIVKKCKILLLDIEGTTTSISFVKDKLFPYAEENVKQFLEKQWESEDVKQAVAALRKLAIEDKEKSVDGVITIPGEDASKDDQIEGLVNSVKWQMSSDRKAGALKQLQGLIWKQGYDSGDIKGHVYDDVSAALEQWHSADGQKVYIYSSGSVQAQKLLFGQSLSGDLLKYIDGHFDTAVGAKQESGSYTAIIEKIGCKADDVLFLTDIVKEAEAARSAGLYAALVSREGNAPLPSEATDAFAVIHSLAQLTVSNKRKTDPQDEQPAKVPKTDVSNDVKTTTEVEPEKQETKTAEPQKENEPEKMEVEEAEIPKNEKPEGNKPAEESVKVVIEEVTDSKEIDAPVVDIEPVVIEESEDKSEKQKETDKMETESTDKVEETKVETVANTSSVENNKIEPAKTETEKKTDNSKSDVPNNDSKDTDKTCVAEETPPKVIMEIEEITNDKENPSDVAEVITDLKPVVEEPNEGEDMEELQNVGEVLEKECDEILSKVQDVTNLDSIPLKPLLNPIEEESMDTENVDSNDIVDRILDTELELEIKKSEESKQKTDESVKTVKSAEEKNGVEENKTETSSSDGTVSDNTTKIEITPENIVSESSPSEAEPVKETQNVEVSKKDEEAQKKDESENKQSQNQEVKNKEEEQNSKVEESNVPKVDEKANDKESVEKKETELVKEEEKPKETVAEEVKVNGKATNGKTESVTQNGDASKDEELSSRLTVENGKEVNGSNGDSMEAENGQGDKKTEAEVSEIKVKTVSTEEPRTDPIEQPTEA